MHISKIFTSPHLNIAAASLLIVAPWLNPIATGPTPAVIPLLFSWLCAAALLFLQQPPRARLVTSAWLCAGLLSCGIGLLQYFNIGESLSPWINQARVGEAFANLRQRNQFATLTSIGLLALLWIASNGSWQHGLYRIVGQMAAALLGIGNAASSSRTGLLQLALIGLMLGFWGGLRLTPPRRLLFSAILAYAAATIFLPLLLGFELGASGILARLRDAGPACASRITLWTNVMQLIAEKPWLGWGWGELDFAHFVTLYPGARFCEILDNAHNLPLHLAVELGIPIALAICGTGLWLVWRERPWAERHPTRQLAWGVLAVILLHSMLEYPLWYGPFQMAFALSILMLWLTPPLRGVDPVAVSFSVSAKPLFGLSALISIRCVAAFLMVFTAYAAWDYYRVSQIYLAPIARGEAYRINTLAKIKGSWLFRDQVQFAELTTTALNTENAASLNAIAHELLHFSPEARVVEKLIDSASLLGRVDEVEYFKARYRAAFAAQ